MPPLSQTSTVVILSSTTITLLLLRNSWILLYQSSNFILSPLNHPGSRTMLFVSMFLLCTAVTGAVNISSVSGIAGSVLWFNTLSSVILSDPNISSNTSITSELCFAILSVCGFYHTILFHL